MKHNNNNLYKVYGVNGALSVMNSDSCDIDKIIISSDSQIQKNSNQRDLFNNHKDYIQVIPKNNFRNKYNTSRTQGIVVYFNYKIYN